MLKRSRLSSTSGLVLLPLHHGALILAVMVGTVVPLRAIDLLAEGDP